MAATTKTSTRDLTAEIGFLTRALKAPTMRDAVTRLADRARSESWTHEEFLVACLQREVSARESHGGEGRIRAARFPARKSIEEFDFDHARALKRDVIAHLGTLDFVTAKDNAEVIGRHLDVPVVSVPADEASEHFGFLAGFLAADNPVSSTLTRELLGWQPHIPGSSMTSIRATTSIAGPHDQPSRSVTTEEHNETWRVAGQLRHSRGDHQRRRPRRRARLPGRAARPRLGVVRAAGRDR